MTLKGFLLMVAFVLSSKILFSVAHTASFFFSVGKILFLYMTAKQDVKVCFKVIVKCIFLFLLSKYL